MNAIDEKISKLRELTSNFIYVEYYSHEECDCYKINNEYTNYKKDTLVLGRVDEGFEVCVDRAIVEIDKRKKEFYE